MQLKDSLDLALKATTTAVAIATAIWAWYRFRRERTHAPHIGFTIGCQFFGPQRGKYLAEIQITAENLGNTRQEFEHIRVRIRGISKDSDLTFWIDEEPRAFFPDKLCPAGSEAAGERHAIDMVYRKFSYVFVEPGVKQLLTYVTIIPENIRFILVHAQFTYLNHDPHGAEKVFEVKVG